MSRSFRLLCLVVVTVAAGVLAGSAPALSSSLVISQVYGGAGCGTAGCSTYQNDYIEIFNRGGASVSLAGFSVQYASATGTAWQVTALTATSLAPGQHYLVSESFGANGVNPLPTADVTGTIAMSATAAKIALVNTTTALSGTQCPTMSAAIIDFVGYGATANCSETANAPAPSTTTADLRGGAGCTETDNNSTDFTAGSPNPRNTASPTSACAVDNPPTVTSTTPTTAATNVAVNSNVTVMFSEAVTVTAGWFDITCGTSGTHTAVESGGPTTYTLDPNADFVTSESCTVTIDKTKVADQDGTPNNMANNYVWSFTTAAPPPPLTPIHTIQGATHISPLNTTVVSTSGIVIAKTTNGFWMQEPDANIDADVNTSEGIFVFTSSAPTVALADAVTVTATACEFRPGASGCPGSGTNLTTTELTTVTSVVVNSTANPLPAATVIGSGGRAPPTAVIEDDSTGTGDVETSGTFDPANDGIDFYESLEGMRVQVNNPVASGPRNGFGEISVLVDNGTAAGVRTTRGGIVVKASDFNPERVILDDVLVATPVVNTGDHFGPTQVDGVMDYSFGNFKFLVTTTPLSAVSGGLAQEVAAPAAPAVLSIATFNVENLDPTDPPSKFTGLAGIIVNNLLSPDILALEEIQDNDGPTNSATTDASTTFNTLISAITTAGGPAYDYRQIDPVDDQDGGEPGGNIRVGFIFRTDTVTFTPSPAGQGGSTDPNVVTAAGLKYNPGRIFPASSAFNSSRKPLAIELTFNGQKVFLIANHFNSKGGDQPLFGHFQPPTLSSEVQRNNQAQIVNDFVDQIIANVTNSQVVVLGDFNDFEFSNPLATLKGGVLTDFIETLPQAERYTYVFDGNSQALDHILANDQVTFRLPTYDVVHVNSEFAVQNSDHEPQLLRYDPLASTTAAVVTSLSAVRQGRSVVLRWRTGSEVGIAGFNVYREQAGRRVRVNQRLIRASGAVFGHRYAWNAGKARSARYWLEVVKLDGSRAWRGPVRPVAPAVR